MPEGPEVELTELHEAIREMHEEREERVKEAKEGDWTKYIALTTALLAVFAAIGSLQAGNLINEGLIVQLRASDTWAEYQASRVKDHLYALQVNTLIDQGHAMPDDPDATPVQDMADNAPPTRESATARIHQYMQRIKKEMAKEDQLSEKAKELEHESAHDIERHHSFAASVALIQVAIALGAVSALTKIKTIWYGSILIGVAGVIMFAAGYLAH